MKRVRGFVSRVARTGGYVAGGAVIAAWLVSLGARASIGADVPQLPKSMLTGELPATPPPMAPLVLPVRDPFAADNLRVLADRAAAKKHRGVAAMQVPDPASFGNAGSSARGVLAVIEGDGSDSYALLEDGANIVIGRVGDAFGGSKIAAITDHGVKLANNVMLAVDDPRKTASPTIAAGVGGGALPMPGAQGSQLGTPDGRIPLPQNGGRNSVVPSLRSISTGGALPAPAGVSDQPGAVVIPANGTSATVTLPSGSVKGVQLQPGAIPGTNSAAGPNGTLFPLLSTPAPNR